MLSRGNKITRKGKFIKSITIGIIITAVYLILASFCAVQVQAENNWYDNNSNKIQDSSKFVTVHNDGDLEVTESVDGWVEPKTGDTTFSSTITLKNISETDKLTINKIDFSPMEGYTISDFGQWTVKDASNNLLYSGGINASYTPSGGIKLGLNESKTYSITTTLTGTLAGNYANTSPAKFTYNYTQESAAEAYAVVYTSEGGSTDDTLEFRYDSNRNSYSTDHTFDCEDTGSEVPGWRYRFIGGDADLEIEPTVTTVNFTPEFKNVKVKSCYDWFDANDNGAKGYSPTIEKFNGLENFDTSEVTNMSCMFSANSRLLNLDLSHFNTNKVTDMSGMFDGCSVLTSLDVTNFDTSEVINMSCMFYYCTSLTSLDVSHFNVNKVTNMSGMFANCSALTSLDVTHLNTSQVTNMRNMFYYCSKLTSLDVTHFNTSQVTNMSGMFNRCNQLVEIDISNFTFTNNTQIGYTSSSSGYEHYGMFSNCINLERIYYDKDISNVVPADKSYYAFYNCSKLPHYSEVSVSDPYRNRTYAYPDNGVTGYFTPKTPVMQLNSFTGGHYENESGDNIESITGNYSDKIKVKIVVTDDTKVIDKIVDNTGKEYTVDDDGFIEVELKFNGSITATLKEKITSHKLILHSNDESQNQNINNNGTDIIDIGDGTENTRNAPMNNYYNNSTNETIYKASDLGGAGTINNITYKVAAINSTQCSYFKIYMGHTKLDKFSSTSDHLGLNDLTEVYSNDLRIIGAGNEDLIQLDTPFEYNGEDNLVIVICKTCNYNGSLYYYYTSADGSCLYKQSDSDAGAKNPDDSSSWSSSSTSVSSEMANIKIEIERVPKDKTVYFKTGSAQLYEDELCHNPINMPQFERIGYKFRGYKTLSIGGNKVLNEDGSFAGAVSGYTDGNVWTAENDIELYSDWQKMAEITLNSFTGGHYENEEGKSIVKTYSLNSDPVKVKIVKDDESIQIGKIVDNTDREYEMDADGFIEINSDNDISITVKLLEAYAVVYSSDSEHTDDILEFRYDSNRSSYPSDHTFDCLDTGTPAPGWAPYIGGTSDQSKNTVTTVKFSDVFNENVKVKNCYYWFAGNYSGSTKITNFINIGNFDTSEVTNMRSMFENCSAVTSLDVTNFDTSQVTSMANMFQNCSALTSLDVTNFNTSQVTSMRNMFRGCSKLTSLDVTNFNTSQVTDMYDMFYYCSALTSLDVTHFDTSKVTDMSGMFYNCSALISLNVTHFDTSKVTNMSSMFYHCSGLTSLDLTNFNTSEVTYMGGMFWECSSLTNLGVSNFNTSKVTYMDYMFDNCSALTSLDVTHFDTSKVTNMNCMFYHCSALVSLDVTHFDTSQVTNMSDMFGACSALASLDVTHFNTSQVTDMSYMFEYCSALTSLDVTNFDTSQVTNMSDMFLNGSALVEIDISNFTFTNNTQIGSTSHYIRNGMFSNCINLERIYYNQDISNVIPLEKSYYAFYNCPKLPNNSSEGSYKWGGDKAKPSTMGGVFTANNKLSNYTWAELKSIANEISSQGTSAAHYNEFVTYAQKGEVTKKVSLTNGDSMYFRIIGINHDNKADGSGKAGLTFQAVNSFNQPIYTGDKGNSSSTYAAGWAVSPLRVRLQSGGDLYALFPSELTSKIAVVTKTSNVGYTSTRSSYNKLNNVTSPDAFFLPSFTELGGTSTSYAVEGSVYEFVASDPYNSTAWEQDYRAGHPSYSAAMWTNLSAHGFDFLNQHKSEYSSFNDVYNALNAEPGTWVAGADDSDDTWQRSVNPNFYDRVMELYFNGNPNSSKYVDYSACLAPCFAI